MTSSNARGPEDDRYNLRQPPPVACAAPRLSVRERVRGRPYVALDPPPKHIATLKRGCRAVAVSLPADDAHERATVQAVRAAMRGIYVCRSSGFSLQSRNDRVCTTLVNAYVGPALERYLTRLATRLHEGGFTGPPHYPVARWRIHHCRIGAPRRR